MLLTVIQSYVVLSLCPFSSGSPEKKKDETAVGRGEEGVLLGDGAEQEERRGSGEGVRRDSDSVYNHTGEGAEGTTGGKDNNVTTTTKALMGAHHGCTSPEGLPPADLVSLSSQEGVSVARGDDELSNIISPPETFSCEDSATPTPQLETESMASGTITPRNSPCGGTNTPISPVSPRPQSSKDTTPPAEVGSDSIAVFPAYLYSENL